MNTNAPAPPPDPASLLLLLRQSRNLLAYHLALGLPHYPATPELRRFAATRQARPAGTTPLPKQQPAASAVQQADSSQPQLANCRRCPNASRPVAGVGSISAKVLVLASAIFSPAEDELFWRMMAAIHLDRSSVYLTTTVKCAGLEMLPEPRRNCLSWLEQELQAVQPRLICALGEPAAWLLTDKNVPMLRLRGKFHPCCLAIAQQAKVLATYAPAFLLQYPAMKEATWIDLQLLRDRLASL
jgi:uracil-DNA glycosylase